MTEFLVLIFAVIGVAVQIQRNRIVKKWWFRK